jgi:hypothetical protein
MAKKNTGVIKKILSFQLKTKFYRFFERIVYSRAQDTLLAFPAFSPYSIGPGKKKAALTIQAINQVFPLLESLAETTKFKPMVIEKIEHLSNERKIEDAAKRLKILLDKHGSDKANHHNYHHIYSLALGDPSRIRNIFEIGLGTNNTDIVSNMGHEGKPGASLRAFRDYCPNACVFGADIDSRILFSEDRIKTFYLDQTNKESFDELLHKIPDNFDLIIDDGLHSPNANIASLEFGLKKIKKNGWIVIEDIPSPAISVWQVVSAILPQENYEAHLFSAEGAYVFAVKRLN